jgi:hypothetical protein
MIRYKKALAYFKRHKFSPDEKRNFRLGGVVSAYGISFAVEKYFLAYRTPFSDKVWFWVYIIFALFSLFWWLEDFIMDLWEQYTTEDDELYTRHPPKE